jgi:hypothetical protein
LGPAGGKNKAQTDDKRQISAQQKQNAIAQHQNNLLGNSWQKRQPLPRISQTHTRIILLSRQSETITHTVGGKNSLP